MGVMPLVASCITPRFSVIILIHREKIGTCISTLHTRPNMTASIEPAALLSNLHRADGSAAYSQNGYTVIGAVNGPIEVQRRDELPEEASVDVIVRPAAGVGGM
jgi:hypothetical protein